MQDRTTRRAMLPTGSKTQDADRSGMKTVDVAILGGGFAGLNAARLLHQAGVGFHLFEARDRLGGRILTVDETGQPASDGFDLGPSWFWPRMQPGLAALVSTLGLPVFAQHATGDLMFERSPRETPFRTGVAGQDQGSMRLAGGMGALVRALAQNLPAECLQVNTPVTHLRLVPGGVILTVGAKDQAEDHLMARHVVSTLPPRLMAKAIRFDPAMDPANLDCWRDMPTWMAPHAKFVAVYDRPFWRAMGLSGMAQSLVGPLGEIHDATTAGGAAALFGFVAVPAVRRATLSQDALIRAAVDQLTRLFGPEAATPRATLVKDWATDPWTATPADSTASGHPDAPIAPLVTGVWADRLDLAGSESSAHEPGYLAGAEAVSDRVARAVIRRMGR